MVSIKVIAKAACIVATIFTVSACSTKTQIIMQGDPDQPITMGISGTDFEMAASDSVQSMLSSGAVNRSDGKKNIMVVSSILNDTMQRIDTDQLVKKIRIELLRSGKVLTTTAIGLNGAEDKMTTAYSGLHQSQKIDKSTLARQRLSAPNMSLSGKIIQKNNRVDDDKQLVEYYFQLSLTDLHNGLAIWEGETPIRKLGSANATAW